MQQDEVMKLREQLNKTPKTPKEISMLLKRIIKKQEEIVQIISILELFNETVYLYHVLFRKKSGANTLAYLDRETQNILETIKNIVDNTQYFGFMEEKIIKKTERAVRKYKDYFENAIDVLYGYYVESRYVNDVINDRARDFFSEELIDEGEFYEGVINFINEVEEEKEERIKEILSSIPFAMSKKRFYEYLTRGLEKDYSNYEAFLESVIDIEENFYGKLIEGYGDFFPHIAEKIEYLQSLDFKHMTREEVDTYFKKSIELIESIQQLREVCFSVLKIINRLLIVFVSKNSFKTLISKEPFIVDYIVFYNKLNRNSLKEIEKNIKTCDNIISNWYFELYRYNLLLGEIDYSDLDIREIIDEVILQKIEILSEFENLLNDTSEIVLEDGQVEEEPIDMAVIKGEIKKVISLIEDISRNMKNEYRKARLRRLMGIIPVPQNFEKEVLHYIKNSIELDNSQSRKLSFMHTVTKKIELYKDLKKNKKTFMKL
ncbi:hypothetical protein [Thermoanaerobacter mathranii]|uniref:hypothetical protein n=1 Tax=Thermoanaerobacter mathranii TaxID=583357 RepID=UPI003AAC68B8